MIHSQRYLPLLTYEPKDPLADTMLLKHRHTVLIRDLPGLDPYMSRATRSLIETNIGDLVLEQMAARVEV